MGWNVDHAGPSAMRTKRTYAFAALKTPLNAVSRRMDEAMEILVDHSGSNNSGLLQIMK
jgi:hypothetical protein